MLLSTFTAYLIIGVLGIVAIAAFIFAWRVSDFFIAPRDYWTKSGYAVLMTKLGFCAGAAYFAVTGASYLMAEILKYWRK